MLRRSGGDSRYSERFLAWRRKRNRDMLVNRLALVVVLRMRPAVRARYGFGGFVGLEAQIADLIIVRPVFQAQAAITEHQIVIGLQILRINLKDPVEFLDG